MKSSLLRFTVLFSLFLLVLLGDADFSSAQTLARIPLQKTRWIYPENHSAELADIIAGLNQANNTQLSETDFKQTEDTWLSGMSFRFYQQYVDELPVKDAGIRLWLNSETRQFIQMVSFLQNPQSKNLQLARQKN